MTGGWDEASRLAAGPVGSAARMSTAGWSASGCHLQAMLAAVRGDETTAMALANVTRWGEPRIGMLLDRLAAQARTLTPFGKGFGDAYRHAEVVSQPSAALDTFSQLDAVPWPSAPATSCGRPASLSGTGPTPDRGRCPAAAARDRRVGRGRPDQQADRRAAVSLPSHGQHPMSTRLLRSSG
jgi:hypothetical protein